VTRLSLKKSSAALAGVTSMQRAAVAAIALIMRPSKAILLFFCIYQPVAHSVQNKEMANRRP
jgi:hypothetical protein